MSKNLNPLVALVEDTDEELDAVSLAQTAIEAEEALYDVIGNEDGKELPEALKRLESAKEDLAAAEEEDEPDEDKIAELTEAVRDEACQVVDALNDGAGQAAAIAANLANAAAQLCEEYSLE